MSTVGMLSILQWLILKILLLKNKNKGEYDWDEM